MARPAALQFLKHGKIICKAVYPLFVETWNWLVRSWDNLRGDFDANPKSGAITIDRTDPDHPVIRLRTDNLNLSGGGSATPDGKSLDALSTGELEFKAFTTQTAETETIAELMTTSTSSAADRNVVERNSATSGSEAIAYREFGSFVAGDDTNVVFTAVNGSVQIDVYYS